MMAGPAHWSENELERPEREGGKEDIGHEYLKESYRLRQNGRPVQEAVENSGSQTDEKKIGEPRLPGEKAARERGPEHQGSEKNEGGRETRLPIQKQDGQEGREDERWPIEKSPENNAGRERQVRREAEKDEPLELQHDGEEHQTEAAYEKPGVHGAGGGETG